MLAAYAFPFCGGLIFYCMQVLVPHSYDVELENFVIFSGHLALMKRTNGLSVISTFPLNQSASALLDIASQEQLIEFDEESYSLEFAEQGPYNSSVLRMTYSSLVTPETAFDVNMASGKLLPLSGPTFTMINTLSLLQPASTQLDIASHEP